MTVKQILASTDYLGGVPPYGQLSGDELAAIPASYRIR